MKWLFATPAGFFLDEKPGDVYRVQHTGPPMQVKKFGPNELPSDKAPIVIEFMDEMKLIEQQLATGKEKQEDGIVRYVFHPADARYLASKLLHALAEGGDRVANALLPHLDVVLEELQHEEDEDEDEDEDE